MIRSTRLFSVRLFPVCPFPARLFPIRLFPIKVATIAAISSLLLACSSNIPAPDALLAETEMRVETAEEAQAGREAPVELRTAQDQLASARQAMLQEDYVQAQQYLEKARVNADYAIIKSRSDKMQRAAEEVRQTLDALRDELQAAQR